VYYLLGEEFDRDPFLIFRLRGMTREDLLRVLEQMEEAAHPDGHEGDATEGDAGERRGGAPGHAPPPNASFWRAGAVPEDVFPERITGQQPGALLLRLGAFRSGEVPSRSRTRSSPSTNAPRPRPWKSWPT
jgi:hypothetical protein